MLAHVKLVGPIVIVNAFSDRVITLRYANSQAPTEIRVHPNAYIIHLINHYQMLQRELDPNAPPEHPASPNATNVDVAAPD